MRIRTLILLILASACRKEVTDPEPVGPVPSAAQLAWHEMEMNAFIHFTTNTFTNLEWGSGAESPSIFAPASVDADQWISTFKDAGFRGAILTCKHHDGFCLWPSAYTEHSVKNSPYKGGKGDVVKEVAAACKKHGLKFGVYLSPWDRNHPEYGRPPYIDYYRNQLREIFTSYGPIFEMWFDGANGGTGYYGGANEKRTIDGSTYYRWNETLDMVRAMEPDVIFFSDAGPGIRWVGNERGVAGETNWNTITPDTLYAGKPGIAELLGTGSENGTAWIPAEVDVSIRPGWFYHPEEDSLVKSPEQLFNIYLTSVGRGSTLLLNVPPDRRGLIHENDRRSLLGFRAMLDSVFAKDHAREGRAVATSARGDADKFSAARVIDGTNDTFWCPDDGITSPTLELSFDSPREIRFISLQENIRLGQRVRKFTVAAADGRGGWKTVAGGTTIGYKRIVGTERVKTEKVRITFDDSKAAPCISTVSLY